MAVLASASVIVTEEKDSIIAHGSFIIGCAIMFLSQLQ